MIKKNKYHLLHSMKIKKEFNKNHRKWFLNPVLKAIDKYSMIQNKEHVCVALSGGIDSITLTYILYLLRKYTHLEFKCSALHVKTDHYNTDILKEYCHVIDTDYFETELDLIKPTTDKNTCYTCSRIKRGAISETLNRKKIFKSVLGHNADDVCETFFMNIAYNRKLGSFSPKVTYDNNDVVFIRPMIYLTKDKIKKIHNHAGLPILKYICPHEKKNKRKIFRKGIRELNSLFHTENFIENTVASLENIDKTNLWENLME